MQYPDFGAAGRKRPFEYAPLHSQFRLAATIIGLLLTQQPQLFFENNISMK